MFLSCIAVLQMPPHLLDPNFQDKSMSTGLYLLLDLRRNSVDRIRHISISITLVGYCANHRIYSNKFVFGNFGS